MAAALTAAGSALTANTSAPRAWKSSASSAKRVSSRAAPGVSAEGQTNSTISRPAKLG